MLSVSKLGLRCAPWFPEWISLNGWQFAPKLVFGVNSLVLPGPLGYWPFCRRQYSGESRTGGVSSNPCAVLQNYPGRPCVLLHPSKLLPKAGSTWSYALKTSPPGFTITLSLLQGLWPEERGNKYWWCDRTSEAPCTVQACGAGAVQTQQHASAGGCHGSLVASQSTHLGGLGTCSILPVARAWTLVQISLTELSGTSHLSPVSSPSPATCVSSALEKGETCVQERGKCK